MYVHGCHACMWQSEDNSVKSAFFSPLCSFWGLNPGDQTCMTSALPTEPYPWPTEPSGRGVFPFRRKLSMFYVLKHGAEKICPCYAFLIFEPTDSGPRHTVIILCSF